MTEDRLDSLLRHLDRPVAPDPGYADRAFAELAAEAGFRSRRRLGWWPTTRPIPGGLRLSAQLVWIVLAVALLAAMIAGIMAVGSQQGRPQLGRGDSSANAVAPSASAAAASEPAASIFTPGSAVLAIGRQAPDWTWELLDGKAFSIAGLRGRPAAILLWCSCVSGPQVRTFLDAARSRDDVGMVLVSLDREGITQGLVDWLGTATPVVQDSAFGLLQAWGLDSYPAMVLLRADGAVADIQPLTFDAARLAAILDALRVGAEVPDPMPLPSPPVDNGTAPPLTTILEPGAVAPPLSGPKLGGGELSTADLPARPTLVQFWLPPHLDGAPQDDFPGPDRLLAAAAARASEVNMVLVAAGEPERGAARRYLRLQDADVPVIFDWDGELMQRWGLAFTNTLVALDAERRVEGVYGPFWMGAPETLLDALAGGDPLPSSGGAQP